MSSIKGSGAIGMGMLNEESKKVSSYKVETLYLPVSQIHPNKRNEMSMSGIEELASQIKALGNISQPLEVIQREDGEYDIITGHRRYTAIKLLIDRGEWDPEKPIRCELKDLDAIKLNLSDEDKEMMCILTSNQQREKTDADRYFESLQWKKIIANLRKNGVEFLVTGIDKNGEEVGENIKGVRTRDIIARQMNISGSQLSKYEKVENNGSDMLKEALKQNKVNISNASNIANMPKEEQEKFIEETLANKADDEQITTDDVAVAKFENQKNKQKKKKEKADLVELPKGLINDKVFKRDVKDIQKAIKERADGIQLSDSQFKEYCRHINGLRNVFGC